MTLDQVVAFYQEVWGEPPANPGASLQEVAAIISGAAEDLLEPFDPVEAHPILSATEMPPDRDIPIEEAFSEELVDASQSGYGLRRGTIQHRSRRSVCRGGATNSGMAGALFG